MKSKTWPTILLLFLLINFITMIGLFGWLKATGRLNSERIHRVVDVFAMTIEDETAKNEQEAVEAEDAAKLEDQLRRAEAAEGGLRTLEDLKSTAELEREKEALLRQRLERENQDLIRNFKLVQELLAKERKQFEAEKIAFEKKTQQMRDQQVDEDFKKTVKLYESLEPKLVKQVFQELFNEQGGLDKVVDYIAAMQNRKATDVLNEFKKPDEVLQAKTITESLRQRGQRAFGGDKKKEQAS